MAIAVAVLFGAAGCAEVSGYDKDVAERLGERSTELRRVVTDLAPPDLSPMFGARERRVAVAVMQGEFASVNERNLERIAETQRAASAASDSAVRKFRARARQATEAKVDVGVTGGASDDVRGFIASYNAFADAVAEEAGKAALDFARVADSNRKTERVWDETADFLATGDTDGLRAAVFAARRALRTIAGATFNPSEIRRRLDKAMSPLVAQANESSKVSSLVRDVRDRYPMSVLNDAIVPRSG